MNHSFYSADKATHVKIVALGVIAAIMLTVGGVAVRISGNDLQTAANPIVKAGKSVVWTSSAPPVVR
jgi:hypothetical protein